MTNDDEGPHCWSRREELCDMLGNLILILVHVFLEGGVKCDELLVSVNCPNYSKLTVIWAQMALLPGGMQL